MNKGPAEPQHDGRRQHALQPCAALHAEHGRRIEADQVAHREQQQRQRQHEAEPEATRHVIEFGRVLFQRGVFRFERHPAYRTTAWAHLTDLRMHGTGVDRIGRHCGSGGGLAFGVEITQRVSVELGDATSAAEVIGLAVVGRHFFRIRGGLHAAHRIGKRLVDDGRCRRIAMVVRMAAAAGGSLGFFGGATQVSAFHVVLSCCWVWRDFRREISLRDLSNLS